MPKPFLHLHSRQALHIQKSHDFKTGSYGQTQCQRMQPWIHFSLLTPLSPELNQQQLTVLLPIIIKYYFLTNILLVHKVIHDFANPINTADCPIQHAEVKSIFNKWLLWNSLNCLQQFFFFQVQSITLIFHLPMQSHSNKAIVYIKKQNLLKMITLYIKH